MRAGTHPKAVGSVPTGAAEKRLSARVSRVSRLCPVFRAQPGAYPSEAQKPDVTPPCGRTGNSTRAQHSGFGRKRKCGKRGKHRNGQNQTILDAAARKQDNAAGSCAPRGGHICPRCGQFRGFTRAFQTQRKTAGGRCGMKKARRFKGNRGVPTKNTR